MKKINIRQALPMALSSFILFAFPILLVALLLFNLGGIIAIFIPSDENAKFDFALIFEQLSDASLSLHWVLPLIIASLFGFLMFLVCKKVKRKLVVGIIASIAFGILFFLSLFSSLMLTSVNGIRFCDLLSKLVPLIDKL